MILNKTQYLKIIKGNIYTLSSGVVVFHKDTRVAYFFRNLAFFIFAYKDQLRPQTYVS